LWWPVWPIFLPLLSASKGLFKAKFCLPPDSLSILQGRPFLGSLGAESLRTSSAPLCVANMPACGISCDGWSCLYMLILRASYSGDPRWPESSHGSSGSNLCSALFSLHLLMDEPSCGSGGSASCLHLHIPIDGTSHGGNLGLLRVSCGSSGS
jgi:hypothetical protein